MCGRALSRIGWRVRRRGLLFFFFFVGWWAGGSSWRVSSCGAGFVGASWIVNIVDREILVLLGYFIAVVRLPLRLRWCGIQVKGYI